MNLKQFLGKIKSFDCKALEDKEIEHCFVDKSLYGYTEPIVDIVYDAERDKIRIVTGDISQTHFTNKYLLKSKDKAAK